MNYRLGYCSYDTVPAPKGAAIHIQAFARAIATLGTLDLMTVSATGQPQVERHPDGYQHHTLPATGKTLIQRVLSFRQALAQWPYAPYDLFHIRSIFEGLPIAMERDRWTRLLLFEVNGLPSIELKYRYPAVADDEVLNSKLRTQEDLCLRASDHLLTPSRVTQRYLVQRGLPPEQITTIPNGVDLDCFPYCDRPLFGAASLHLVYFGTLSPWQGIDTMIRAFALLNAAMPTHLTLIGYGPKPQLRAYTRLAEKLCHGDRLHILPPMPQPQLVHHLHQADVIVAPLAPCDRNLVQGCCPLKVLEGMATGIPVVSSRIPAVTDLGQDQVHFVLTEPGSSSDLAAKILGLSQHSDHAKAIAQRARQHIAEHFTWQHATATLLEVYGRLLNPLAKP
ncbi:MAG: glycosyltransferase family 4 protein [Oscillatoriales cyanobacterium SM2_2_1]|nr:glycosyltransferase family 4 protein [Oscillatoriales cyanobacterium SM2_2_1]